MAPPTTTRPQGVRIEWSQVAAPVRAAVERELGSEVVSARNHAGGFSPGTAARVELADGRVVFVKAVSSALNDVAVDLHRAEAEVLARLPPEMPVPRLQARIDVEVDGDDWVALVIDHADGTMPHRPWRPDELARVLAAIDLAARAGTPSPSPTCAPPPTTTSAAWRAWTNGPSRSCSIRGAATTSPS